MDRQRQHSPAVIGTIAAHIWTHRVTCIVTEAEERNSPASVFHIIITHTRNQNICTE